jgi:hypothetical protein
MGCRKVSVYWPLVGEQSPMTQDLCPEIENIDKDPPPSARQLNRKTLTGFIDKA